MDTGDDFSTAEGCQGLENKSRHLEISATKFDMLGSQSWQRLQERLMPCSPPFSAANIQRKQQASMLAGSCGQTRTGRSS